VTNSVPERNEFGYRSPHPIRRGDFVDKIFTALEDKTLPRRGVITVGKAPKVQDQKQQQVPKISNKARSSL
jgi:hypothetical protein